jgi:hypothetical protein
VKLALHGQGFCRVVMSTSGSFQWKGEDDALLLMVLTLVLFVWRCPCQNRADDDYEWAISTLRRCFLLRRAVVRLVAGNFLFHFVFFWWCAFSMS